MATVFSGGTYVNTTFTASNRQALQYNWALQLSSAGMTNTNLATGQGPGNFGTVAMTTGTPGTCTFSNHGWLGGESIIFQTTGVLPTGLTSNVVYFVKFNDANTFFVSSSSGGANINFTGTPSGIQTVNSQNFLLLTQTQQYVNQGLLLKLRDNLGTCIQCSIQTTDGLAVGGNSGVAGGGMAPGANQVVRIIATRYHHYIFYPGAPSAGHQYLMAGMPYVPANLVTGANGTVTNLTNIGYMLSNASQDSSTTACQSFRVSMQLDGIGNTPNVQCIYNGNILDSQNANNFGSGYPELILPYPTETNHTPKLYRWANDQINAGDALIGWGLSAFSDEGKIKGQLLDTVYIADAFAPDVSDTFSGHNWWNLTNNNSSGTPRGGLWIATS